MLWASESSSAAGSVGQLIVGTVDNSGEINHFAVVSPFLSLLAKYVVHLDIPIGNVMIMKVFDCLAELNEDDPSNTAQVISLVFLGDILDNSAAALIAAVQLHPDHDLAQLAQLMDAIDAMFAIDNLETLRDVLMLQFFNNAQLSRQCFQGIAVLPTC